MVIVMAYIIVWMIAAIATVYAFSERYSKEPVIAKECGRNLFYSERSEKLPITKTLPQADGESNAGMLSFLHETCCALPVRAETVHVLSNPLQFYEELQRRVRAAQHRIVISALYIGDGPLSQQFVACLESKVIEATQSGQSLDISLLLDYNRMHDRRNLLAVKQLLIFTNTNKSSNVHVQLFLFQSSCRWNRLLAPISRAKEALGVQHTKIFCFDDQDTILTGANLSDDYFVTRMDRYVVIEENPLVAAWFSDLVHTLCRLSHRVVCREEYIKRSPEHNNMAVVHKQTGLVILPNVSKIDPSHQSAAFAAQMKHMLQEFAARNAAKMKLQQPDRETFDTFLFPSLQYGRAGVYHDSVVVQQLLRLASVSTHVYLTSPYLNMHPLFVDEIVSSESKYDFITASVDTNGWRGANGFAGYIPFFYLQLERAFYYLMRAYGRAERVQVWEFNAKGLSFHAKGLWFVEEKMVKKPSVCVASRNINTGNHEDDNYPNNNQHNGGCDSMKGKEEEKDWCSVGTPCIVAYGSTNYGYRSVHKDVEVEAFMFTTNQALREKLRDELVFLLQQSKLVSEERFVRGAQGRFQPVISLLAHMGQEFL